MCRKLVTGAQSELCVGRAVERDGNDTKLPRLAGGKAAWGDGDRARRAGEEPLPDGAQQHPAKRAVVGGADDDQVGIFGEDVS